MTFVKLINIQLIKDINKVIGVRTKYVQEVAEIKGVEIWNNCDKTVGINDMFTVGIGSRLKITKSVLYLSHKTVL